MPNDASSAAARRVLVVDDDVDFGGSLADMLSMQGYEARVVDRPEAAMAALGWDGLAVVMLDVRLGLGSGVELLLQLNRERSDLVYVMMSAYVDTKSAIDALRHGAYDYCDKGSEPSEIYAVLARCFERRQLQEERRAAYDALRLARDEAEAARIDAETASRAKSEFLATMSHELRTPLNAIIGFSQILMSETMGPIGNAQYLEYAGDIHASGAHLLGIINDILDLSKAESGKLDLDEGKVDICEVVAAACRMVRRHAERTGLSVRQKIVGPLPSFLGDDRKLTQILANLLSNAVKFTPKGGTVEIQASFDPGAGFEVSVSDTGIGIAPEDIKRVLDPFVQVENSLTRVHQGSGLGLPLATRMTEMHGGTLAIDSELGKGTRVTLHFPAERTADRLAKIA
jgi:signal transduction histidine kinase